jgi:hypothetical protein
VSPQRQQIPNAHTIGRKVNGEHRYLQYRQRKRQMISLTLSQKSRRHECREQYTLITCSKPLHQRLQETQPATAAHTRTVQLQPVIRDASCCREIATIRCLSPATSVSNERNVKLALLPLHQQLLAMMPALCRMPLIASTTTQCTRQAATPCRASSVRFCQISRSHTLTYIYTNKNELINAKDDE